jgi:hypothetical protein
MLSTVARLMLTASSIAPVSLTYAWVAYIQGDRRVAAVAFAIGLLAVFACLFVLRYAKKHLESLPLKLDLLSLPMLRI